MRFLADECVSAPLIAALRNDGHDVIAVAEIAQGIADGQVLELASREARILLTEDKDFGDLAFRRHSGALPGIVLMRINPALRPLALPRLRLAIERYGDRLGGHYTVVRETQVRSRPLRPRSGP